jgi:hypothetical protein
LGSSRVRKQAVPSRLMASAGFCLTRLLTPVRAQDAGRLQVRADTSQIAAVDRRRGCVRAREGHRGSIAEYCDGLQAYPSSVRLDDVSYPTGSGRSVRTSNYRVPAILLNLPPLLRHRLARYKTLLNDTLRRWRPIDSRVSAAIDPRCPSRARSQGPSAADPWLPCPARRRRSS